MNLKKNSESLIRLEIEKRSNVSNAHLLEVDEFSEYAECINLTVINRYFDIMAHVHYNFVLDNFEVKYTYLHQALNELDVNLQNYIEHTNIIPIVSNIEVVYRGFYKRDYINN